MGMNRISAKTATTMLLLLLSLALPAAASDYTLGVFGNANEDETINMQDVTYTELIILEYRDATELSDAKHDGKINMQDVTQIELVILGKEKEITLVDSTGRIVTAEKPLNRIVVACSDSLELLRAVKLETDRVVGVASGIQSSREYDSHYKTFFPEYPDKQPVDSKDTESILSLDPDIAIVWMSPTYGATEKTIDVLNAAGVAVICAYGGVGEEDMLRDVERFGYLFDKRDEADTFVDWYEGVTGQIEATVGTIPNEDKPTVYVEGYQNWYISGEDRDRVGSAGGTNIFDETRGIIDPEEVIVQNPEIMVKTPWGCGGYHIDADDTTGLAEVRDEIMSRAELSGIPAVKDGRVHVISGYITTWGPSAGCRGFLSITYMAKWFQPDLFADMDPEAIHQEYLTEFQGLDIDLNEKGVFVYPLFEES